MPETRQYETLSLHRAGDVLTVTLDRPRRANAVSRQMMTDLVALADALVDADDIAFVVLRGGDRIFSAGADLKELAGELAAPGARTMVRSLQRLGQEMVRKLNGIEQTVIAALHGSAYGAGVAIALTADFRVMADTAVANMPETRIGLFLTYGCTPRLVTLIGPARTQEFIAFAEDVPAATCLDWGMVTEVAAQTDVDARVDSMIERLRARDRVALRVTKKIVRAASPTTGDLLTAEDEIVDGVIALGAAQAEIDAFVGRATTEEENR